LIGAPAAPPKTPAPAPGGTEPTEDGAMKQALAGVREMLAKWRRVATPTDFLGLRAQGPAWARAHPLKEVMIHQQLLLEKGEVAWGALLQANNALFKPGPDDHPGAMLYSRDPYFEGRPQGLGKVARTIFPHSQRPCCSFASTLRSS
jgi:hypothetical protein